METSSLEPPVRVTCSKQTTWEEKKRFLREDRFEGNQSVKKKSNKETGNKD